MITATLVNVYGRKRESFDLRKAEFISVSPDSNEVRITYSWQEHLIPVKDGGGLYINVYGILPKRLGTNHPDGITKNVTDALHHINSVYERIDNQPLLKEYIMYRLFPTEFGGSIEAKTRSSRPLGRG